MCVILRNEMKGSAMKVLRAWGLQHHTSRFMSCADGLALIAHLCNAAAKFKSYDFYDLKPALVQAAAEAHPFSWHREGVVYIETCVGQVSFHVFGDVDLSCIPERATPWAGGWMQDKAYEMALAFIGGEDPRFETWLAQTQPLTTERSWARP